MHAGHRRQRRMPEGRELVAEDEPPPPRATVSRAMQVIAARTAARRGHGRRGPCLRPGLSFISGLPWLEAVRTRDRGEQVTSR
jgi:hypothetical protein